MPDLLRKSMDWFLCDNGLRHERVKNLNDFYIVCYLTDRSKERTNKIVFKSPPGNISAITMRPVSKESTLLLLLLIQNFLATAYQK